MRIAINGMGRIGRLVVRQWLKGWAPSINIVAVNDVVDDELLCYLLRYDSVHGPLNMPCVVDDGHLVCGNKQIRLLSQAEPRKLPWAELDVDMVMECSGRFTERSQAEQHLAAGARRVLISAPAKGDVPHVVLGVNEESIHPLTDSIISNASCTTNCLAPVAKVIHQHCGLKEGLMTTIHAVTATQSCVDGPSKKDWRGGRSALANIIPSSTGAAKAVGLCMPELNGRLTGMALRVPTTNVSCVDLTFRSERPTSYEQLMLAFEAAAQGPMSGILDLTRDAVVSSDFVGSTYSSIVDAGAGIQLDAHFFKIIAWYDNEMGYSTRMLDVALNIAHRASIR